MCKLTIIGILLLLIKFDPGVLANYQDMHEAKLFEDLFVKTGYNRNTRPVRGNPNRQMQVFFWLMVKRLENLNEKDQTMTTFGWLGLNWYDEILTWDPERYGGIQRLVVPADNIWLPEVSMFNSVDQGNDLTLVANYRATVNYTGIVHFAPGYKWTTSCPVNLKYFPYDTQVCNVSFVNWVYLSTYVNFSLLLGQSEVDTTLYTENREWSLESTRVMRADLLPYSEFPMPQVTFELTLKRRPEFLVMNIVIPATLMSLLSALVFCLPAESGEKVGLGITVLLSFSVVLLMINDITPRIGQPIPILTIFVVVNMVLTAVSLSGTVLVLSAYHHYPNRQVPKWLKVIVLKHMARLLRVSVNTNHDDLVPPIGNEKFLSIVSMVTEKEQKPMNGTPVTPLRPILSAAAEEYYRYKNKKENYKRGKEQSKEEWQNLSRVLDRFLFLFFLVVSGITSSAITGVIMK